MLLLNDITKMLILEFEFFYAFSKFNKQNPDIKEKNIEDLNNISMHKAINLCLVDFMILGSQKSFCSGILT